MGMVRMHGMVRLQFFRVLIELLCIGLIVAVMAGFKGKLSSMTLCFLLLVQNFVFNFYWAEHSESAGEPS
jgi:uncharacterized membrane protein YphA (DoxX/SURF4 family)